jgi:hypothetical protein
MRYIGTEIQERALGRSRYKQNPAALDAARTGTLSSTICNGPIAACPQDPRQIAAGHIHILLIIRPKLQGSTVSLRNLASCPPLLYLGPPRCIPFPSSRPLDPSSSSTARSLVSDHFGPLHSINSPFTDRPIRSLPAQGLSIRRRHPV